MARTAHARADDALPPRVTINHPHIPMEASMNCASPELSAFVSEVLTRCLDIREVWCIRQGEHAAAPVSSEHELLAFADATTLQRLRQCDDLHRRDVDLLVVVDGDRFENAWGPRKLSGSLARWAWRQVSDEVAYYDESIWAERERNPGSVVRVRRKATLVWQGQRAMARAAS